jgi:hypothetical protein
MSVDPLKARAVSAAQADKIAGGARRAEPAAGRHGETQPLPSGDSVELSSASLGMVEQAESGREIPRGELPADRIHAILRRLADGFYDRTEVRDELAGRVRRDLPNLKSE